MKSAPCKGCMDRHTACSDKCDKYKEWRTECKAEKAYTKSMNENAHEYNYNHRADMRARRRYKKFFGGV